MGRKRKTVEQGSDSEQEVDLPPKHLQTPTHGSQHEKRLIVILENAQLETAKAS